MEDLQKQLEEAGYKGKHSLSSYIEACGEGFQRLDTLRGLKGTEHECQLWWAKDERDIHGMGKTPEEAVARLWLELNKKK